MTSRIQLQPSDVSMSSTLDARTEAQRPSRGRPRSGSFHRSLPRWLVASVTVALVASACTAEDVQSSPAAPGSDVEAAIAAEADVRAALAAQFEGLYPPAAPDGGMVEIELVAREGRIDLVAGGATEVWTYNGTVPGPQIDVRLGETVRATLRNELSAPTSVHWHGIRVPNDMDGVPGLNQTAVAPGETFVYEFAPPDSGTYWYHSHTLGSEQLDRGLYGAIVVADAENTDAFDVDTVWMLDDWLLDESGQVMGDFFDNHQAMHYGRRGELLTMSGQPSAELIVRPGERVRLRLVNASNGRWYEPALAGLGARVLAVDGQLAGRTIDLDGMLLGPGNRLDIVFDAPLTPGSFPLLDMVFEAETPLGTVIVEGSPVERDRVDIAVNGAVPDWSAAADLVADVELDFDVGVDPDGFGRYRINDRSYPDVEPIHLEQGKFTKIRLFNRTGLLHPIHLHGQFFKVLTRNGVPVDEPYFRDTVFVDFEEVVEIGIVPPDTGQWLLHCHIQEHADAGMATVAIVRPPGASLPDLRDLREGHIEAPLTGAESDTDGEPDVLA